MLEIARSSSRSGPDPPHTLSTNEYDTIYIKLFIIKGIYNFLHVSDKENFHFYI